MEKEKKPKRLNFTWCVLIICIFLNALIISFIIVNCLNLDRYCIKEIIIVFVLVVNCVSVIMLAKHCNDWIQLEKDDFIVKLEHVTEEYKECVKQEKRCPFYDSLNVNYSLCKTLEMTIDTFNDRECDDSKLKTLITVLEAVLNSHKKDKQEKSNSGQCQKSDKKQTNS